MLDNFFGVTTNSVIQFAFRYGMFLMAAPIFSLLAIKISMSLLASANLKARKEWQVQPVAYANQSPNGRIVDGCEQRLASQYRTKDLKH